MTQGLNDKRAILQVLGNVILKPTLMDDYPLDRDDFSVEAFHEIVFACIYNLYQSGVKVIDCFAIDSFLSNYEKQYKIFNDNNGTDYVNDAVNLCEPANFEYNYKRLKKFSYLRFLEDQGFDTRTLYDTTKVEPVEQEKEMAKFDNTSIEEMIDQIDIMLTVNAKMKFSSDAGSKGQLASQGMKELKAKLKEEPDFGIPLASPIMTTITRGARKKKLYLRSSASGGGKSRLGIGDLCNFSVPWFYDIDKKKWVHTGFSEGVLFISTELEPDELQTAMMAYISGVDEECILGNTPYGKGEEERVDKAIEYFESSPFYIEVTNTFNIQDITNLIKKYKREKGIEYVCFDYVHICSKLIMEIAGVSKGMKLRDDMVYFLFIDELKNLCNKLNIFVLTMTQLNGSYKDSPIKDETMLRGAKSMADRIDVGIISLPPSAQELQSIKPILAHMVGYKTPNLVQNIYKLRRGKLTKLKVWQYVDLGTCRSTDLFVTNNDYKLIPVEATTIERVIKEESVNAEDIVATQEEQQEAAQILFNW